MNFFITAAVTLMNNHRSCLKIAGKRIILEIRQICPPLTIIFQYCQILRKLLRSVKYCLLHCGMKTLLKPKTSSIDSAPSVSTGKNWPKEFHWGRTSTSCSRCSERSVEIATPKKQLRKSTKWCWPIADRNWARSWNSQTYRIKAFWHCSTIIWKSFCTIW